MRVFSGMALAMVIGLPLTMALGDEVKTSAKFGGAFDITALSGDSKGKSFCYV